MVAWKRFFGMGMHIIVLFSNMVLMVNLLIAIMSDQYSLMSEVRTGLYWSQVIREMPKLQYDNHYGVLNILPFFFYWISLLVLPLLLCIKDRSKLKTINQVCFHIVYFPLSIIVLAIFMTVNAALIPAAYFKTILHKILLLKKFKSASHSKNLVIFIVLGLPFLLCA